MITIFGLNQKIKNLTLVVMNQKFMRPKKWYCSLLLTVAWLMGSFAQTTVAQTAVSYDTPSCAVTQNNVCAGDVYAFDVDISGDAAATPAISPIDPATVVWKVGADVITLLNAASFNVELTSPYLIGASDPAYPDLLIKADPTLAAPTAITYILEGSYLGADASCPAANPSSVTANFVPLPIANAVTLGLCETNNGTADFTLTDAENAAATTNISGTDVDNGATGVTVTYHATQADADANTGALSSPYAAADAAMVYARIADNTTNCYSTAVVTFDVTPAPEAGFGNGGQVCNLAAEGTTTLDLSTLLDVNADAGGTWSAVTAGAPALSGTTVDGAGLTAGDSYVYRYTVAGTAPCADDFADFTVTIMDCATCPPLPVDFSYGSPVCDGTGTISPSTPGTAGGTWSAVALSPAGAAISIDAANGDIDLSATDAGTFRVSYTIAATASCPAVVGTFDLTINAPVSAGLDNTTATVCNDATEGTTTQDLNALLSAGVSGGGTWAALGSAPAPDAAGIVDGAGIAAGTMLQYTYTVTGTSPCPDDVAMVAITVTDCATCPAPPVADFTLTSPVCETSGSVSPVLSAGSTSGVWSASPAGLAIDPASGAIDVASSIVGVYTVTNSIAAAGACPAASATASFEIIAAPEAGFGNGGQVCNLAAEGTTTLDLSTLLDVNADAGGTWSAVTAGAPALSGTTVDGAGLTAGDSYVYRYTVAGTAPCADDFADFTVTVMDCATCPPLPVDFSYGSPVCDGTGTISPSTPGTAGGTWSAVALSPAGAAISINTANGDIDLSATDAGTFRVSYTIAATASCPAVVGTFDLTINAPVSAGLDNTTATVCNDATEGTTTQDLNALLSAGVSGGGTWAALGSAPAPDAAGIVDGAGIAAGTMLQYTYTVTGTSPCPDDVAMVAITVTDCATCPAPPVADFTLTSPVCETSGSVSPVLSAGSTSGVWSASPAGLAIDPASGAIDIASSIVGVYTVTNSIAAAGACPAASATASFEVIAAPEAGFNNGVTVCNTAASGSTTTDLDNGLSAGVTGGTWSAVTAGAPAIDANNVVDGTGFATGAEFVYAYTITATAPCVDDVAQVTVTVLNCDSPASLGNYVWYDMDADGVQDAGEPGIQGVTVTLYNGDGTPTGLTATTDATGFYEFTNLNPGDYYVVFGTPAGYLPTDADQGGDDAADSDAGVGGQSQVVNLSPGENDTTIDAGFFLPASLGDYVWLDSDADGVQDAGEVGIEGVTVTLYTGGGTSTGLTATTDASGFYQFTNLAPGDYYVVFGAPAGYSSSPANQGGDDATDSDAVGGQSATTTLDAAENDPTLDAGFYQPVTIGDFVWLDTDGDGVQDAGEAGIPGVSVTITLPDGTTTVVVTDANGLYTYTGVPGTYTVTVPGSVNGNNSTTPITLTTTLTSGQSDLTLDFGYEPPTPLASLGDYVWLDSDADGVQDAGELGIEGVTVTLYTGAGALVGSTTTDASGFYQFDELQPGDYYVVFGAPAGYSSSPANQGGDDATDSDAVGGQSATTTLSAGEYDPTLDAGFYQPVTIGDFVWLDTDGDGVQDAGEAGIPGVSVTITLPDGTTTVVVTDANGLYTYTGVPGTYTVTVPGSVNGNNSTTPITLTTTLTSGQSDLTLDFGYEPPTPLASLGDYVWLDSDADGVQDAGELGIEGVTVTLYTGGGTSTGLTATTDASGFYQFTNLAPGDYYVVFGAPAGYSSSPANQGGDDATDSDAVGGQSATTTLDAAENDPTLDAGFYQPVTIGDFVWLDTDGDGVQDAGEAGIPGVSVTITLPDGTTTVVVTDANGLYTYTGVPGTYTVTVPGSVNGNNSTTPITLTTTLTSGQSDLTLDFGYEPPTPLASLGDYVWLDSDADGVQDAGELGIEGVTVTLYTGGGTSTGLTATTDASGFYQFTNLAPGDYYVVFGAPAGYSSSPANQGGDDATDSDAVGGQSATTTLDAAENDPTLDAGFYQPVTIGDFVWLDTDGDGVQDAGEAGIPGVSVTITLPDGTTTVVVTDANGLYTYTGVPGTYTVTVPGSVNGNNSTTPITLTTTLTSGQSDLTLDFGYEPPTPLASLGDYVWLDSDADGVQDAGELGIEGVTVTLYTGAGALVGSTTTDASGFYQFDELQPGDYYVVFGAPAGYSSSPANQGGDDATDSDAVGGQSATTTLSAGEYDPTLDAGFYQPVTIGDFVWLDTDGDGVQDAGEAGIPGVSVTITLPDGTTTVVVTDANGLYTYTGVPGTYTVTVPGSVNGNNSTTPITLTTTLTSGQSDLTLDFGYEPPTPLASLGDYVWLDSDADGVQDAGELGIEGVTVTLYTGAGALVGSTTTDADGLYIFDELQPGDYYVVFGAPAGYSSSPANQGGDDATDSDAVGGQSATTTLSAGEYDPTLDAGFYQPVTIGDFVWLDTDGDGVQDAGEAGIPGVSVTITLPDGTTTVVVTDANGLYTYTGVPGTYTVTVPGSVNGNNSTTPITLTTTLTSGQSDLTLDFGYEPPTPLASLGDYVWLDSDADGVQDAGELGIEGVTVTLYTGAGALVGSTTTDADGLYIFDELQPGDYYVVFGAPAGYSSSPANQGSDAADSDAVGGQSATTTLSAGEYDPTLDAGFYQPATLSGTVWLDTDGDGIQDPGEAGIPGVSVTITLPDGTTTTVVTDANGNYTYTGVPGTYTVSVPTTGPNGETLTTNASQTVTLTSGQNLTDIDFGYQPLLSSIGDFVWLDANANGVQDAGEVGIEGVTVTLYTGAGALVGSTTTDASGFYQFDELQPGDYYVVFGAPAGYSSSPANQGSDAADSDAVGGQSATTTLSAGEYDPTLDAGFYQPATLSGTVWLDTDGDGIQDPGEAGIPGVSVTITLPDGTTTTVVTDANGNYTYTGVPGTYTVSVPTTGPNGETLTTNASQTVTLTSGQNLTDIDFGYQPLLSSIGDFVWLDANANGVQDAGEVGIEGVTVTLYTGAGALVGSTTTDADGLYIFDELQPGDYYLVFGAPAGYSSSPANQGSDAADSDAVGGQTATTTLSAGEYDPTFDAGFYQPVTIGDLVWLDTDGDGIQDPGEAGIPGVSVTITLPDGTTTTVVTDANGNYTYTGVPGTYTVSVPTTGPNGETLTTNASQTVTLTSGQNLTDIDFGYQPLLSSIGDFVWLDANANGVQDAGEVGIEGVTVTLYTGAGALVGSTTTDADGLYIFDELQPGDYYVVFGAPAGYSSSPANQGSDAADSDAVGGQTATTTLSAGEYDPTFDAGFYQPVTIGDLVWLDQDGDGVQDPGEPGIPGVTVTITLPNGTTTTVVTDANGNYTYTGVPGTYTVSVPATGANGEPLSTPASQTFTLTSGETNLNFDFGYTALASIGDCVWLDSNADGIQDLTTEPGINGVWVYLYSGTGTLLDSMQTTVGPTGLNGYYTFYNLIPGDYYIVFGSPGAQYALTPANQDQDHLDSDATVIGGVYQSPIYNLSPNENDPTVDAGFYQSITIGDFVWSDTDGDGVQDAGELGIPGVTVTITLPNGTTTTVVTDANGNYTYTGVPGTYSVSVPATGANGETLSTPATQTFTLTSGQTNLNFDFGYEPPTPLASLGDYVWLDSDADGVQDAGELGIEGVTVTLYTGAGALVGSTTTDATGFYQFDDLTPGDYYVVFGSPAGYSASPANQGSDAADSDAVGGQTATTTLGAGEYDPTFDAGFYQPATLGGTVWTDTDGDGIQDPGEAGVPGVTVTITLPDGTTTTVVTDANGNYTYTGVPGTYTISVPTTGPNGETLTTNASQTVTLTSGQNLTDIDFGYQPLSSSIGNFVWLDANANGVQDAGEVGIQGVTVTLYTGAGALVGSTTTDASGFYIFDELQPGDYYLVFGSPAGYSSSPANQGSDAADSDAVGGQTATTTLGAGEYDQTFDAGFYQPVTIGDFIWSDTDGDGVQDAGEPGIPGVTVTITLPNGTTTTVVTDASGNYTYTGAPGTYTISVPSSVNGNNASTPTTITTTLTSGQTDLDNDFGYAPLLGSIGNFVWLDADADGVQEAGEPGISGVQVQLFNAETGALVSTTTTGSNGQYLFDNLAAGDYFLVFTNPNATHVVTPANAGSNDNLDSDINPNGTTATVTLSPGEDDLSIDAGYYPPTGLGDSVWFDENHNYIQDINEPGIPGVLVSLYDSNGNLIDQVLSDANGHYQFTGLVPGTYTVTVPFFGPNGYLLEGVTGQTTTLIPGEFDTNIDFPYITDDGGGQEIDEACTDIFTPIQLCVEVEPGETVVEDLTSTTFNCNITDATEECVTYHPFPGFEGTDTVYIAICQINNPLICHYEPVIVNVGCVAPHANADNAHIYANSVSFNGGNSADNNGYDGVVLPVTGNDNETCDTGMTVTQITNDPDHGTVTITPTGGINYVPNAGYTGTDQFVYLLCNECGSCDTAVVNIVIDPQPEPCESEDMTVCTEQGEDITICPEFCLNGDYQIVSTHTMFNCSISIMGDCINYNPLPGFVGQDVIEIVACTAANVCDTVYVNITVGNCNGCETWTTEICTVPMQPHLICPEFCLDGEWSLELIHTTFSCSIQLVDDCVRYTALPLYSGPDTVMMVACNAAGVCDTAYAYIQVGDCGGNAAPVAVDDAANSDGGAAVTINVTNNDNDPDGDALTVTMFTQPAHGTVTQVGNQLIYTPDEGFEGNDTFTYQVCDADGLCDMATVTVTVTNNACDDEIFMCAEPSQPIVLCPDFCGLGNGPITLSSVHTTFNCSIQMLEDGCFRYTALPLFAGEETIRAIGCNALGVCDTVYYIVNVTPDCDASGDGQGGKIEGLTTDDAPLALAINGIMPIPAVTYTDINFTANNGSVKVTIYDINGKLTATHTVQTVKGANTLRLDLESYAAGMYVINVQSGTEVATAKFVKQQ
jgi:hypothetical protein